MAKWKEIKEIKVVKQTKQQQKEEIENSVSAIDILSIYDGTHKSQFAPLVKIHYERLIAAEEAKDSATILTSQFELDRLLQLVLDEKKRNNKEK